MVWSLMEAMSEFMSVSAAKDLAMQAANRYCSGRTFRRNETALTWVCTSLTDSARLGEGERRPARIPSRRRKQAVRLTSKRELERSLTSA